MDKLQRAIDNLIANGAVRNHAQISQTDWFKTVKIAIDAIKEKQAREKPLTEEELREMDGEPVYLVPLDIPVENPSWVIAQKGMHWFDYGKSWIAYRTKPGEGV